MDKDDWKKQFINMLTKYQIKIDEINARKNILVNRIRNTQDENKMNDVRTMLKKGQEHEPKK